MVVCAVRYEPVSFENREFLKNAAEKQASGAIGADRLWKFDIDLNRLD
jgi:hypothetical protein